MTGIVTVASGSIGIMIGIGIETGMGPADAVGTIGLASATVGVAVVAAAAAGREFDEQQQPRRAHYDDDRRRDFRAPREDDQGGGPGGRHHGRGGFRDDAEGRERRGRGRGKGDVGTPERRSPTPEGAIPLSQRRRKASGWDVHAPGYEQYTALQAKQTGSGFFILSFVFEG